MGGKVGRVEKVGKLERVGKGRIGEKLFVKREKWNCDWLEVKLWQSEIVILWKCEKSMEQLGNNLCILSALCGRLKCGNVKMS